MKFLAAMLRATTALPAGARIALAVAAVLAVGAGDDLTHAEVFTVLYLCPISLIAWVDGRRAGVAMALFSSGTWLAADLLSHPATLNVLVEAVHFAAQLGTLLAFSLLVSALRTQLAHEQRNARTDPLTDLANARAFHAATTLEIERARRFGAPFSVAYCDVDKFKQVNDQFGHRQGDVLLQQLAYVLRGSVRKLDLVARLGGDEFAVLFPGTGASGAAAVVAKLRQNIAAARWPLQLPVRCSIGCVTFTPPPASVDELIALADRLMYQAKRHGDGHCSHEVYAPEAPNEGTGQRQAQ